MMKIGPSLAITHAASGTWSPSALFSASELGTWQESSPAYVYQDSIGTTAVTADSNPVGLRFDKKKWLALGAEVIPSGGITGYTAGNSAVITVQGTDVTIANANNALEGSIRYNGVLSGRTYEIVCTCVSATSAGGVIVCGNARSTAMFAGSTYKFRLQATADGWAGITPNSASSDRSVTFRNFSVRELPGNHGRQATTTARPLYKAGPDRIDYDGVDDKLTTTFSASLGSACTVARAIPGTGASILTGQTVGTSFDDSTDNCALVIVNRALTTAETASLTGYLNRLAGV